LETEYFQQVIELLYQTQFDNALQIVESIEEREDLTPKIRLKCQILRSKILAGKGDCKESIKLAETVLTASQRLGWPLQEVDAYIVMAGALEELLKFDDSLKAIDLAEQKLSTLTGEPPTAIIQRKASLAYQKGRTRWQKFQYGGSLDDPLPPLEQSLAMYEEINNKHGISLSLRNIGVIYDYKGDQDLALEYYQRSLALAKELGNKQGISDCLNNIGQIYRANNDADRGLEYFQQSLALNEEIGNRSNMFITLVNIGATYLIKRDLNRANMTFQKMISIFEEIGDKQRLIIALIVISDSYFQYGEFNLALEFITKSLAIYEEIDDKSGKAYSFNVLGRIYLHKGELELASDNLHKSLAIYEDIDDDDGTDRYQNRAWPLLALAATYQAKGDSIAAFEYFKKCLVMSQKSGSDIVVAYALYSLVTLAIDKNQFKEAKSYSQQLKDLYIQVSQSNKMKRGLSPGSGSYSLVKNVNQLSRLSEALLLKNSSRLRDKINAQEIFQQIANEETEFFSISFDALLNLCELLLFELRTSEEEDVFIEVKGLVQRFTARAKETHSFSSVVNALILQAKFSIVEGDLTAAAQLLDQAQITAEEKDLLLLAEKVSEESQELKAQYDNWQRLIHDNAPFQEQLEKAQIDVYLKEALNLARLGRMQPNP
jgi:tetratricopeptide (TPR) repeat protein